MEWKDKRYQSDLIGDTNIFKIEAVENAAIEAKKYIKERLKIYQASPSYNDFDNNLPFIYEEQIDNAIRNYRLLFKMNLANSLDEAKSIVYEAVNDKFLYTEEEEEFIIDDFLTKGNITEIFASLGINHAPTIWVEEYNYLSEYAGHALNELISVSHNSRESKEYEAKLAPIVFGASNVEETNSFIRFIIKDAEEEDWPHLSLSIHTILEHLSNYPYSLYFLEIDKDIEYSKADNDFYTASWTQYIKERKQNFLDKTKGPTGTSGHAMTSGPADPDTSVLAGPADVVGPSEQASTNIDDEAKANRAALDAELLGLKDVKDYASLSMDRHLIENTIPYASDKDKQGKFYLEAVTRAGENIYDLADKYYEKERVFDDFDKVSEKYKRKYKLQRPKDFSEDVELPLFLQDINRPAYEENISVINDALIGVLARYSESNLSILDKIVTASDEGEAGFWFNRTTDRYFYNFIPDILDGDTELEYMFEAIEDGTFDVPNAIDEYLNSAELSKFSREKLSKDIYPGLELANMAPAIEEFIENKYHYDFETQKIIAYIILDYAKTDIYSSDENAPQSMVEILGLSLSKDLASDIEDFLEEENIKSLDEFKTRFNTSITSIADTSISDTSVSDTSVADTSAELNRAALDAELLGLNSLKDYASLSMDRPKISLSGLGGVPDNKEVLSKGFSAYMKPSDFLFLAAPRGFSHESNAKKFRLIEALEEGKEFAPGFLNLEIDEENKKLRVLSHEGRHRAEAIKFKYGDIPIEYHFFIKGRLPDINLAEYRFVDEKGEDYLKVSNVVSRIKSNTNILNARTDNTRIDNTRDYETADKNSLSMDKVSNIIMVSNELGAMPDRNKEAKMVDTYDWPGFEAKNSQEKKLINLHNKFTNDYSWDWNKSYDDNSWDEVKARRFREAEAEVKETKNNPEKLKEYIENIHGNFDEFLENYNYVNETNYSEKEFLTSDVGKEQVSEASEAEIEEDMRRESGEGQNVRGSDIWREFDDYASLWKEVFIGEFLPISGRLAADIDTDESRQSFSRYISLPIKYEDINDIGSEIFEYHKVCVSDHKDYHANQNDEWFDYGDNPKLAARQVLEYLQENYPEIYISENDPLFKEIDAGAHSYEDDLSLAFYHQKENEQLGKDLKERIKELNDKTVEALYDVVKRTNTSKIASPEREETTKRELLAIVNYLEENANTTEVFEANQITGGIKGYYKAAFMNNSTADASNEAMAILNARIKGIGDLAGKTSYKSLMAEKMELEKDEQITRKTIQLLKHRIKRGVKKGDLSPALSQDLSLQDASLSMDAPKLKAYFSEKAELFLGNEKVQDFIKLRLDALNNQKDMALSMDKDALAQAAKAYDLEKAYPDIFREEGIAEDEEDEFLFTDDTARKINKIERAIAEKAVYTEDKQLCNDYRNLLNIVHIAQLSRELKNVGNDSPNQLYSEIEDYIINTKQDIKGLEIKNTKGYLSEVKNAVCQDKIKLGGKNVSLEDALHGLISSKEETPFLTNNTINRIIAKHWKEDLQYIDNPELKSDEINNQILENPIIEYAHKKLEELDKINNPEILASNSQYLKILKDFYEAIKGYRDEDLAEIYGEDYLDNAKEFNPEIKNFDDALKNELIEFVSYLENDSYKINKVDNSEYLIKDWQDRFDATARLNEPLLETPYVSSTDEIVRRDYLKAVTTMSTDILTLDKGILAEYDFEAICDNRGEYILPQRLDYRSMLEQTRELMAENLIALVNLGEKELKQMRYSPKEKEENIALILNCKKQVDTSLSMYSVWVGAGEVNDNYLTKTQAKELAETYLEDGYDDVAIERLNMIDNNNNILPENISVKKIINGKEVEVFYSDKNHDKIEYQLETKENGVMIFTRIYLNEDLDNKSLEALRREIGQEFDTKFSNITRNGYSEEAASLSMDKDKGNNHMAKQEILAPVSQSELEAFREVLVANILALDVPDEQKQQLIKNAMTFDLKNADTTELMKVVKSGNDEQKKSAFTKMLSATPMTMLSAAALYMVGKNMYEKNPEKYNDAMNNFYDKINDITPDSLHYLKNKLASIGLIEKPLFPHDLRDVKDYISIAKSNLNDFMEASNSTNTSYDYGQNLLADNTKSTVSEMAKNGQELFTEIMDKMRYALMSDSEKANIDFAKEFSRHWVSSNFNYTFPHDNLAQIAEETVKNMPEPTFFERIGNMISEIPAKAGNLWDWFHSGHFTKGAEEVLLALSNGYSPVQLSMSAPVINLASPLKSDIKDGDVDFIKNVAANRPINGKDLAISANKNKHSDKAFFENQPPRVDYSKNPNVKGRTTSFKLVGTNNSFPGISSFKKDDLGFEIPFFDKATIGNIAQILEEKGYGKIAIENDKLTIDDNLGKRDVGKVTINGQELYPLLSDAIFVDEKPYKMALSFDVEKSLSTVKVPEFLKETLYLSSDELTHNPRLSKYLAESMGLNYLPLFAAGVDVATGLDVEGALKGLFVIPNGDMIEIWQNGDKDSVHASYRTYGSKISEPIAILNGKAGFPENGQALPREYVPTTYVAQALDEIGKGLVSEANNLGGELFRNVCDLARPSCKILFVGPARFTGPADLAGPADVVRPAESDIGIKGEFVNNRLVGLPSDYIMPQTKVDEENRTLVIPSHRFKEEYITPEANIEAIATIENGEFKNIERISDHEVDNAFIRLSSVLDTIYCSDRLADEFKAFKQMKNDDNFKTEITELIAAKKIRENKGIDIGVDINWDKKIMPKETVQKDISNLENKVTPQEPSKEKKETVQKNTSKSKEYER